MCNVHYKSTGEPFNVNCDKLLQPLFSLLTAEKYHQSGNYPPTKILIIFNTVDVFTSVIEFPVKIHPSDFWNTEINNVWSRVRAASFKKM